MKKQLIVLVLVGMLALSPLARSATAQTVHSLPVPRLTLTSVQNYRNLGTQFIYTFSVTNWAEFQRQVDQRYSGFDPAKMQLPPSPCKGQGNAGFQTRMAAIIYSGENKPLGCYALFSPKGQLMEIKLTLPQANTPDSFYLVITDLLTRERVKSNIVYTGTGNNPVPVTQGATQGPAVVTSNETILENEMFIKDGSFFENTAKVVPPKPGSQGCVNGQIAVMVGDPRPGMILHRPLFGAGGAIDTTSQTDISEFPGGKHRPGTDNQMVRLKDGSLVAIRDSYIWNDLTPQPSWFKDHLTVSGYDFADRQKQRAGELLFRSTDCGSTWALWSTLDFGTALDGKYGIPRPVKNTPDGPVDIDPSKVPSEQSIDKNGNLMWWVGGGDRTELYACPFTGNLYLTTRVISGPYKNNLQQNKTLLMYYNGKDWELIKELPAWAPTVMTSTPDGRLFVFQQAGTVPTIYFSLSHLKAKEKPQLSSGYAVHYVESKGRSLLAQGPLGVNIRDQVPAPSLSRYSTDSKSSKVRVAYECRNSAGNQQACIIDVDVQDPAKAPIVNNVGMIQAADPKNESVMYFTFIDPDYIDMPTGLRSNASVLYWLEAPREGFSGSYSIRYTVFRNDEYHPPNFLSVKKNKPWTWDTPKDIGDYMTGGFFWANNSLNYFAQWVEPTGIRANIVTISNPGARSVQHSP